MLPTYATNVTHRRWLRLVKPALAETVASEVFITGLSHVEVVWSEVR
jgi:hypothetical protein